MPRFYKVFRLIEFYMLPHRMELPPPLEIKEFLTLHAILRVAQ